MSVITATKDTFQKEVLSQKNVVLVDFYADWCGPCKLTTPIIEELSEQMKEVRFVKVDVDQNSDVASQYSVFSIPTFLLVKDGKVVSQFVGAKSKEAFVSEIEKVSQ